MLTEVPLQSSAVGLSQAATEFVEEGKRRFSRADCFDFVPSDYDAVWRVLASIPVGRFCEWGSGWGIVTGLAEMLGHDARGIELDERLARESRQLLSEFKLHSPIVQGDYLTEAWEAETYYLYCWPTRLKVSEERFEQIGPVGARLLVAYGQSDIRCKVVDCQTSHED